MTPSELQKAAEDGTWCVDEGISGSILDRPGLHKLLALVKSRSDVTDVYFWKRNRLARSVDPLDGMNIEREIEKLKLEKQQGKLFDEEGRLDHIDRSIEEKEEEVARRRRHYEEVREQLDKERERILNHLLPKRHAMSGEAQVFPICLEVRLPGGGQ